MHIIHFVLLSSHCRRIQPPHPQRAFTAHHVPWPPFSSSPRPRHMNAPCRAARSLHGTFGWRWITAGSSSVPALRHVAGSIPSTSAFHACMLTATCHLAITSILSSTSSNFPVTACGSNLSTHIRHQDNHRLWSSIKTLLRQGAYVKTSTDSTLSSFSAFWFQQGHVACNQGPRAKKLPDCMG